MDNQADPAALADEAGGADPKVDTTVRKSSKSKSEQAKNSPTSKNGIDQEKSAPASSDAVANGAQGKNENGTSTGSDSDEAAGSVFTKQAEKRSDATVPKGLATQEADAGSDGSATPSPPPASRGVFEPASVTKPHRFPDPDGQVNPDSPFKSVSPEKADASAAKDMGAARKNPPVGDGADEESASETTATLAAAALARELTGAGFATPGFTSSGFSGSDAARAGGTPPPAAGSVFTRATQAPGAPAPAGDRPPPAGPQSSPSGKPPASAPASAAPAAGGQSAGPSAAAVTNTKWTIPGSASGTPAPPPTSASAAPAAPPVASPEWTGIMGSGDRAAGVGAGVAAPSGPAYSPPASPGVAGGSGSPGGPGAQQGGMPTAYGAPTQAAATQLPPTQAPQRPPSAAGPGPQGSVRSGDLMSKIAMPFARPGKKKKSRPSAVRKPGGAIGNGKAAVTVKSKSGPAGSPTPQLAPRSVRQDGIAARDAQLVLSRIEPWSVMKFSFLASLVGFVVLIVAVAVLYFFFSALGVFTSIEQTVHLVTSSGGNAGSNAGSWFSLSTVMTYTMLAGAIDVILITALSTVAAVVYNAVSHLSGGIEITLQEAD